MGRGTSKGGRAGLVASSTWALGGRILAMAAFLAINAVLARELTQADLGRYLLSYSIVFVLASIGRLGLQQLVVRFVGSALSAGDVAAANKVVGRCLLLGAAAAACLFIIVVSPAGSWGLDTFGLTAEPVLRLWFGLWLFSETFRVVASESLRAFNNIRAATILGDPGRNIVLLAIVVLTPTSAMTLNVAVAGSAVTGLVLCVVTVATLGARLVNSRTPNGAVGYRDLLRTAVPLVIAGFGSLALSQVDVWIVGAALGHDEVAIYGIANRVSGLLTVPLFVINAVTVPYIARLAASPDRRSELSALLRGSAAAATIPMLLGFVVLTAWGPEILTQLFGSDYRGAWLPLVVLCAGQVANVVTGLCGVALIMTGHQRAVMTVSLLSSVVMIASCLVAARTGNLVLVATACSVAITLQNLMLMLACRRRLGILTLADPRPKTIRSAVAASLSAVRSRPAAPSPSLNAS